MGLKLKSSEDMEDTTQTKSKQVKRRTREPASMSQKLAWLKAIHADKDLSPAAKNVAVALFMRHNSTTGLCCVTQGNLGEAVALKRGRVNQVVGELKAAGWITAEQTLGASYYLLHVDRAAAKSSADVSTILHTSDDGGCIESCTAGVQTSAQQVSTILHTEPSVLTVYSNHLSLHAPAGAKAEREKSASGGGRQTGSNRKPSSQPTAVSMPANFDLTPERESIAVQAGIRPEDIRAVFQRFTTHAAANGRQYVDWNAGWKAWCLNAVERQRAQNAKTQRAEPKPSRFKVPREQMR